MNVFVGREAVVLDDAHLLGMGGEGRVYRLRDRAVKIFHAADAAKIAKISAFPRDLPSNVLVPLERVTDARGAVVGFTMRVVERAADVMRLSQRRYRDGVIGNGEVMAIFRGLRELLATLHANGVVVGDLNDGNVLFKDGTPFLIDADSMQLKSHRCTVAHERFLDPRLFGVDLATRGGLCESTDWYAFAVLLFASLLYVHPYGGLHPTLPTMLRRAEARHSVLRSDVRPPKVAAPATSLPDALLDYFGGVFDGDARGPIPAALLDVRWTRCACGLEHARARCPRCASTQATRVPVARGRLRVATILRTRGRVVACSMHGSLRFVYEENGIFHREDGHAVAPAIPDTRVAMQGTMTWIGEADRIVGHRPGHAPRVISASPYRGGAAFDANANDCVYADGALLRSASSGKHLGPILEGQTYVRLGARLGFGMYQVSPRIRSFGFLFRPERGGLVDCALPPSRGRVTEIETSFDDDRVLFAYAAEVDGRRVHAMHLFDDRGALVASAHGAPDDRAVLESVRGKCLAFGAIVSATDDGLLLARVANGSIVEEKVFPETSDFVHAGSELVTGTGGSIYVVNEREILHLSYH